MSKTVDKIVAYIEGQPVAEPTHCFAVPGESNIIDCVHPETGLSVCYKQTLEQVQERHPGAQLFSLDDWCAARAASQDGPITWSETTAEAVQEMLNVLPPAISGCGGFLVGEPWDHHAVTGRPRFQGLATRFGKYYASNRPMTVQEYRAESAKENLTIE